MKGEKLSPEREGINEMLHNERRNKLFELIQRFLLSFFFSLDHNIKFHAENHLILLLYDFSTQRRLTKDYSRVQENLKQRKSLENINKQKVFRETTRAKKIKFSVMKPFLLFLLIYAIT